VDSEYVHPCWCIEACEKIEGARISLVSLLGMSGEAEEGLFELQAPDVLELIAFLRKHEWVKKLEVLQKTGEWALAKIVFKRDSLLLSKILLSKATPLLPTLTKGDRDFVTVILPSGKELRKLSSLLKDDVEYWVRQKKFLTTPLPASLFNSKDFLKFKLVTEHLPEKQRDAFLLATRKGYYAMPKKASVEELAEALGVSPSTAAEHLRKAEATLLPLIARVVDKLQ